MKIPKHYIGKVVKLTWEDPRGGGERVDIVSAPKGKAALAKWEEYGLVDDITDGVVRIRHSDAYSPGDKDPDEALFTWVVEDLVVSVVVLSPEVTP